MDKINYDYFYKNLKYLASDSLKGRYIGTEGFYQAADYIGREFAAFNLKPFGDSESYFQSIHFNRMSIKSTTANLLLRKGDKFIIGDFGIDYSLLANFKSENNIEKQKIVNVGYGNIIPEENINDYAGVNVVGKTVLVAVGGPREIKHPAFEDILLKVKNAEQQGAKGIILYYPQHKLIQGIIFRYVHSFLTQSALHYEDTSIHGSITDVNLALCTYAKMSFMKKIFKLSGQNFSNELRAISRGEHRSRELPITLDCSYSTNREPVNSMNVVALLPGSDPILKNEYIVLGAHLDHLGVGKKIRGDSIYNGMVDNASGCSALLCIAKTFSQMPVRPKRSVVFVSFTAEEAGLYGSHYFINRNNIKDGRIVGYLNIDMVANLFESNNIYPVGYLHSNMAEALDFAACNLQINVSATRSLDETYLERGDQLSFIRQGIPSLYLIPGNTSLNPAINGYKQTNRWLKKYYHSPFDDLEQPFSPNAFVTGTKLNFLTLYYLSNNIEEIRWNKRSWVYDKYVGSDR